MFRKSIYFAGQLLKSLRNKLNEVWLKFKHGSKISIGKVYFGPGFDLDTSGEYKLVFGWGVSFRSNGRIRVRNNASLYIADNVYFNNNVSINCLGKISIGENTLFGEDVKLYDHNHKFSDTSKLISQQGYSIGEINIGKNCWIGSNVVILKDVHIGDHVIIGANCLIDKDVEPNRIVKMENALVITEIR